MFRRCPSCKKLFDAVEVKTEVLGGNEFEEPGRHGLRVGHVENIKITFKCKNCGHEWSDLEQRTL
jgi:hypothetical protein